MDEVEKMGDKLLKEISEATGLPSQLIDDELIRLISEAGKSPSEASLEDLREVMAQYLQEVILGAKEKYGA